MKLNKMAATAAMAGALGSAALGIGAGIAQADPNGPGPGGPNVPGPNVPGPNGPGQQPGPGYVPICNPGAPGVNCTRPGTPLPPGQHGTPPPGQYNDPQGYGLPATWVNPPNYPVGEYPIFFNPDVGQWGATINGQFVVYTP
ncbi:hypothetical protein [Mycobacterium sp. 050134]|uniref:hypothetical protein n=1 Tax=Mycobacterium sp. 050134 TaxID=3096111 RepID=UPI002EDBB2CE